ncbi:MAG: pyruvate kinase [Deltaproteobacteria bacterium]|nr:MAG: pyruvate kinase [Deltaproteobacteria bacterium]
MDRTVPRTKIVCTIGPASDSPEMIRDLIQNGMNVARLNFSHGTPEEHREKIRTIRRIAGELGRPVAILQDLAGPKIRVGDIPAPGVRLETGKTVIFTSRPAEGASDMIPLSHPELPRQVKAGDTLLLADGYMEVKVTRVEDTRIRCRVISGGLLTARKGINLPSRSVSIPSLTEKDRRDLLTGLENEVDYVALSFVRTADDICEIKRIIRENRKDTPVIAKIEKHEAVKNMDAVIAASDAIMVARGDLGVEIPLAEVPLVQKKLIRKANMLGKPVITATQMLRSMVDSPRPTRAEATDVANAVLDGTDAVMLSEETASGSFPLEAVKYMAEIIKQAEEGFPHGKYLKLMPAEDVSESVAHASCVLADHLHAAAIVATTQSGMTAGYICRYRPRQPVIALSQLPRTVRRLSLVWGCIPRLVSDPRDTDDMFEKAARSALRTGILSKGDVVVITAGHPVWVAGTTNMIRVKRL